MPHYRQVGEVPRKRHTQFRQPDGSLYAEELMGEEGFNYDSALLYHRHLPTELVAIEGVDSEIQEATPNHPLLPRHFKTHELKTGGDAVSGRHLLMLNEDCRISYAAVGDTSPLTKNATGDEMVFIESGSARLESTFGALDVGPGDYVIVPASTIHRWVVDEGETVRMLILETRSHIGPPRRYLSRNGQLLEHAPYCERDIRAPSEPLIEEGSEVDVLAHSVGVAEARQMRPHHVRIVQPDGTSVPLNRITERYNSPASS